jgi:hypothetical protein
LWVAAGYDFTVLTSPDGVTWTSRDVGKAGGRGTTGLPSGAGFSSVIWADSQFVLIPDYDTPILTSRDGITWAPRVRYNDFSIDAVVWTGTTVVAVGYDFYGGGSSSPYDMPSPYVMFSPDGTAWTKHSMEVNDINSLVSYQDGVSVSAMIWARSRLVTVGGQGEILTSPDGKVWVTRRLRSPYLSSALTGVAWTGTRIVAVGRSGAILTSP